MTNTAHLVTKSRPEAMEEKWRVTAATMTTPSHSYRDGIAAGRLEFHIRGGSLTERLRTGSGHSTSNDSNRSKDKPRAVSQILQRRRSRRYANVSALGRRSSMRIFGRWCRKGGLGGYPSWHVAPRIVDASHLSNASPRCKLLQFKIAARPRAQRSRKSCLVLTG